MTQISDIRNLAEEARPAIEQWLEAGELIAGFREIAKDKGIEWSQLKAVIVARVKDEQDGGDRLEKLTDKADRALSYADALLPETKNKIVENPHKSPPVSVPPEPTNPLSSSVEPARAYPLPPPTTPGQSKAVLPAANDAGSSDGDLDDIPKFLTRPMAAA